MKKYRLNERAWQNKTAWKLVNENWTLAHVVVELLRGYKCIIPDCGKEEDLDLDHGITRQRKIIFFDIRHLGYLCKSHHTHKSKRKGDWVDKKVDQIHMEREGKETWQKLIQLAYKDCPEWRTVGHQEKINLTLKQELEFLEKTMP